MGIFQVGIFWLGIFRVGIFQGGIWWVGIFRVGVSLIPFIFSGLQITFPIIYWKFPERFFLFQDFPGNSTLSRPLTFSLAMLCIKVCYFEFLKYLIFCYLFSLMCLYKCLHCFFVFFQRKMFCQESVVYKPATWKNWVRFKMELKAGLEEMTYIFLNRHNSILWHFQETW